MASERMSLSFPLGLLHRYFGSSVFNHTGAVDLRLLRPVLPGNTITFAGTVTSVSREVNASRVSVEIKAQNQRSDTTGVGQGSAVIPNAFLPQDG